MNKTALIIDTFDNYFLRSKYVFEYLKTLGYDVTIITSNFSHSAKSKVNIERESTLAVDTVPYTRNLSLQRIKSHMDFAKKVYKVICDKSPILIYCLVPLNSLVKYVKKYTQKNEVKVYFDVFDLWPESLPTRNSLKKFLFIWKNLRDKNILCAEKVFLECDYYKKFLPKSKKYVTAFLCKPKRNIEYCHDTENLNFLYLGAINNIIDIKGIVGFLGSLNIKRKVLLHIIGKGEKIDEFKNCLQSANIDYVDHGAVYDENIKDMIISKCHFGINMYKPGLCIGLTMKSLDYFCRGLPIISSNIFDTAQIIKEFLCGFNIDNNVDEVINALSGLDEERWQKLSGCCRRVYDNFFAPERFGNIIKDNIQ